MEYFLFDSFFNENLVKLRMGQGKGPLARQNFVADFSTGFSLITRERKVLQTCKLAYKILHQTLRRMVLSFSGNKQYLKNQFSEIVCFSSIFGFFPDFSDFVTAKRGGGGVYRICMKSFICPTLDGAAYFSY